MTESLEDNRAFHHPSAWSLCTSNTVIPRDSETSSKDRKCAQVAKTEKQTGKQTENNLMCEA